ncbi:hypothetical protein AAF712_009418 [Marasmius tenuissimus]|uniref:Uncharacterized protein n=1 Tax=Marasmius tenuissimus TaxID=585030 RepID=A0ABR2ZPX3_9AGAR
MSTQSSEDEEDIPEATETAAQGWGCPPKAPSKNTKQKQTEVPPPELKTKCSRKKPVQAPLPEPPPPEAKCKLSSKKPEQPPLLEPPRPVPKPRTKTQKTIRVVSPEVPQDSEAEGSPIEAPHVNLLEDDSNNPFVNHPGDKEISFVLSQGVEFNEEGKPVHPEFFVFNNGDIEVIEDDGTQGSFGSQAAFSSDEDVEEEEEQAAADEDEEAQALSDSEPYVTPGCKKKKKAQSLQAKAAARKHNQANWKKWKKVTFQDQKDLGNTVAAVSGSSDEEDIGPAPLKSKSCKAGSRLSREDRPHILHVYAGSIVPFFKPITDNEEAACKFCM